MVLINDKKYSCATCIKGHRSSSCTHNDRPLFEVKKKGRPVTQCQHCRKLRKDRALHIKCDCAGKDGTSTPPQASTQPSVSDGYSSGSSKPTASGTSNSNSASTSANAAAAVAAKPAFPNGFRDVHAMNQAAEALHSLTRAGISGEEGSVEAKVRRVDALLNPCRCQSGGKCQCCRPRARVDPAPASSGTSTPISLESGPAATSTDKLADMFSTVSTSTPPLQPFPETSRVPPAYLYRQQPPALSSSTSGHHDSSIHVSDTHHPAHTSPYVHKAKLYSPYSPNMRHLPDGPIGSTISRPSTRPHVSSSSSSSIDHPHSHSNNTLPSIRALSAAGARRTRIKDLVLPRLLDFPTAMEITLDGCTCGENCACPGCAVHPQQQQEGASSNMNVEMGNTLFPGRATARFDPVTCPTSCTSCFDCRARVSVPAGIPTIDQLITVASSAIPAPSSCRSVKTESGGAATSALELDGYNMSVLPPAVLRNEEAAEAWGLTKLKPLDCCNGRCQCSPGNCKCESDCCGCCSFCSCGEAAPMHVDENSPYLDSMHAVLPPPPPLASEPGTSSCCRSESTAATSAALETGSNLYSPGLADHYSVESFAARPHLSTEYSSTSSVSQADTDIIDISSPEKTVSGSPVTKSCCKTQPSEPPLPTPPSATEFPAPHATLIKPRPIAHASSSLSRSSSVNKHAPGTSHTPKPILPRPTSAASSSTHNVSVIQTKNGAKHQLVLPPSSRTMQVEKSLQRRASGKKVGTYSSGGHGQKSGTTTGTATPFNLLGSIPPLAGPNGVLSVTIPPSDAPIPSEYHQPDSPFNNHAFDLLPVVPVRSDPLDDVGSLSAAEASEDDGIWDLVDDGERWILPSAPPPDDLLAGFDIPEGSWLVDGLAASVVAKEDGADQKHPRT